MRSEVAEAWVRYCAREYDFPCKAEDVMLRGYEIVRDHYDGDGTGLNLHDLFTRAEAEVRANGNAAKAA